MKCSPCRLRLGNENWIQALSLRLYLTQTLLQKFCLKVNNFLYFLLTFHLPDVTNKQCLERDRENCAHLVKDAKKLALENSIEYSNEQGVLLSSL